MAAENKRQAGGKGPAGTMGPNLGPSGTVSLEVALSGAIGARVRVTTGPPTSTTIEGTVFTACPITNILAINTSPLPPTPMTPGTPALAHPGDFHVIPISRIQGFQLISLPPQSTPTSSPPESPAPFTNAYPAIYPLDMRSLRSREAAAVAALHEREQRRGKGVTKEAQDLFDAFSRTMPTRWDGASIIVADTVIISPPYHVDDCRPLTVEDGGAALTRVRKVLEMERKKMEFRNDSATIGSSANFPRSVAQNEAGANANKTNTPPNATSRDRDSRVAVPIRSNIVHSPPPGATSGAPRKGG